MILSSWCAMHTVRRLGLRKVYSVLRRMLLIIIGTCLDIGLHI